MQEMIVHVPEFCIFRELILYMLHVSGALRCDDRKKNCLDGCYVNGIKDGKPDEHINELLERDQSGMLTYQSDMLNTCIENMSNANILIWFIVLSVFLLMTTYLCIILFTNFLYM